MKTTNIHRLGDRTLSQGLYNYCKQPVISYVCGNSLETVFFLYFYYKNNPKEYV